MGIFSILFGRREKPINIDDQSHRHFMTALSAHYQAEEASTRGSISEPHLRDVAIKHVAISRRLDGLLEANERSRDGS